MASPLPQPESGSARVSGARDSSGRTLLALEGRLDSSTTGGIWRQALELAEPARGGELVVEASALEFCDGAGASLLLELRRRQEASGGRVLFQGLGEDTAQLIDLIAPSEAAEAESIEHRDSFFVGLGKSSLEVFAEMRQLVAFTGHLTLALGHALRHPGSLRLKDTFEIAERAGIGAVPIIALVGFLLGLILSFQSAIPMKQFGAEIYVADLLGISLIRELGPLMAAILLTARSGSAFAAEIGTMKVNEEIDALTTMGLEPVRFLVVPRVLAAIVVLPVLIMLMNLSGLMGGVVVFLSLDFPVITFVNRIATSVGLVDLFGGLFKGMVYGIIVAAVGCLRGMETGAGASAVGQSTTSSVVSGIVLIAVAAAIFSIIFYILGI